MGCEQGGPSTCFLLRCPTSSLALKSLPQLSTAATRSGRSSRRWRRSHRSPTRTQKLSSPAPTILGGRLVRFAVPGIFANYGNIVLICRPFVVPDILLSANTFVDYRPRHTLRLHCICHRQRAGSWPLHNPLPHCICRRQRGAAGPGK